MNRIKSLSSLPGYYAGMSNAMENRPQIALFRLFAMDIPDKISQAQSLPISNIPRAKHLVKLKITTRLNPHSARLIVSQVPPTNLGECQNVQPEQDLQSCLAGNGILQGTQPEFCITIPMIVLFEKLQQS